MQVPLTEMREIGEEQIWGENNQELRLGHSSFGAPCGYSDGQWGD